MKFGTIKCVPLRMNWNNFCDSLTSCMKSSVPFLFSQFFWFMTENAKLNMTARKNEGANESKSHLDIIILDILQSFITTDQLATAAALDFHCRIKHSFKHCLKFTHISVYMIATNVCGDKRPPQGPQF